MSSTRAKVIASELMRILVSGATKTFRRYTGHPFLGHLKTPRNGNRLGAIVESGHPWGCDNDCGPRGDKPSAFDPDRFRAMIAAVASADTSRLLWVACPDVVADAAGTLERFEAWGPEIASHGLPVALVGQDGAEDLDLPWDRIDVLFLGGSTGWKLSAAAESLIFEAQGRGKRTHMGRVNTRRRLWHAWQLGIDTVDGTSNSKWPDKYFPRMIRWLSEFELRGCLWSRRKCT